jgi:hypothetical protein
MRNRFLLIISAFFWCFSAGVMADDKPAITADPEDQKVIAVMEILEFMEMMDDIDMFKDMEYLTKGDPNESQK